MSGILVAVAQFSPHPKFWPQFCEWYARNREQWGLSLDVPATREPLHKVQHKSIDKALRYNYQHILFVEDDHWAFPENALEKLVGSGKEVIGLHTFMRNRPAYGIALRRKNRYRLTDYRCKLTPVEPGQHDDPVQKVDLIGWGFTLVQTQVFPRLKSNPFLYWGTKATDAQFCQACEDVGVERWVHLGGTIGHGDVGPWWPTRWAFQQAYHIQQWLEFRQGLVAMGVTDDERIREEFERERAWGNCGPRSKFQYGGRVVGAGQANEPGAEV